MIWDFAAILGLHLLVVYSRPLAQHYANGKFMTPSNGYDHEVTTSSLGMIDLGISKKYAHKWFDSLANGPSKVDHGERIYTLDHGSERNEQSYHYPRPSIQFAQLEDPLLISGDYGIRYVMHLLSHGLLYFDAIPHKELILRNQQMRIDNHLAPHRLSSIRPYHPFYRY